MKMDISPHHSARVPPLFGKPVTTVSLGLAQYLEHSRHFVEVHQQSECLSESLAALSRYTAERELNKTDATNTKVNSRVHHLSSSLV